MAKEIKEENSKSGRKRIGKTDLDAPKKHYRKRSVKKRLFIILASRRRRAVLYCSPRQKITIMASA